MKKLTNDYISVLCNEFDMLYNAGVAPYDGALLLLDDEKDRDGRRVLQSMIDSLEQGKNLADACRESGYFPAYMVSMLEAGEKTGRITETLKALAKHYQRQELIAKSLHSAVLYPALLLIMMVSVVTFLLVQVLPMFNEVFERLGTGLPPLAEQLMFLGRGIAASSAVIAGVVAIIVIVAFVLWLLPRVRDGLTKGFRRAFGHRGLMGSIASSRFASGLALSVASGLETTRALELAIAISSGSAVMERKYMKCVSLVKFGNTLSDAMLQSGIFNARNTRMMSLGTKVGMLDAALAEIADREARSVQDDIDRLIGRVEPTLVIISSVITGIILLSVMLPLMGIMTVLG
ncbi:MAG: type II secretion system F family protein [Turicibacter sp.]|nr:type II secretion system F family protein [Turicibacter sp.]